MHEPDELVNPRRGTGGMHVGAPQP